MKIIHTADWHLDSPLTANLGADKSKKRKNELLNSFMRMTDFAKENGVDAILISGDLFDGVYASKGSKETVYNCIKSNPDIDFFYLRGNHDEEIKEFDEISNLKLFSKDFSTYECGEVVIGGCEKTPTPYHEIKFDEDKLNILMLHGEVRTTNADEIISISELCGKNIDYLALGHIHSFSAGRIDNRGEWAYPGCPDGRGYDECGSKGFLLLDTEDGKIKTEFIEFESRKIEEFSLDVTGADGTGEVLCRIENALSGVDKKEMIKVRLTGKVLPECQINTDYINERFSESFFDFRIYDETKVLYEPEKYRFDETLKGEFIRFTEACDDFSEEEKRKIIETGLKALSGEGLL